MDEVVSIPFGALIPASDEESLRPVRGVGWVLRWAATFFVLSVFAVVVVEFGYRVLAEQSLIRAAQAGVREAALPRANRRSVERVIRGQLDSKLAGGTKISLRATGGQIGSPVAVSLSAPADTALPKWLQLVTVWNSSAMVTARVGR